MPSNLRLRDMDIPEGFVLEQPQGEGSGDLDMPPGFELESLSPGRNLPPEAGASQRLAWLAKTAAQDPGRVAKAVGRALYDFTLGPLETAGQLLREGRTPEQAAAWERTSPEERITAREHPRTPLDVSQEELDAALNAALVGSFVGKSRGAKGRVEPPSPPPVEPRRSLLELGPGPEPRVTSIPMQKALPPGPQPRAALTSGPEAPVAPDTPRTGLFSTEPRPTIEAARQFESTVQRYRNTLDEVRRLESAGLPVPKFMRRQLVEDFQSLQPRVSEPTGLGEPASRIGTGEPIVAPSTPARGPVARAQAKDQARLQRAQARVEKLNQQIKAEEARSQGGGVTLQAGLDPKGWLVANTLRMLSRARRAPGEPMPAHVWNIGKEVFNKVVGPDVVEKLDTMLQIEKMKSNRFGAQLKHTPLNKLSPEESLNLVDASRGRATSGNAKVEMALRNWDLMRTNVALEIIDKKGEIFKPGQFDAASGARLRTGTYKPFDPGEHYYPEIIDYHYITKIPEAQLLTELSAEMPWAKPEVIQDIVTGIRAQAIGRPIPTTIGPEAMRLVRKMQTGTPHLMARSGIEWPSKWLLPPQEALPLYAKNMAHELAVLDQFGPRDIGMEGPLKVAAQRGVPGVDLAYKVWDELIRGRAPHDPVSKSVDQFHSMLGNLATLGWISTKTAIKQFSQIGLVAGEARSLKNFLTSFPKAVSKAGKLDADWWGATFGDIERDLLMASRKDILHPSATGMDTIERATRHAATWAVYKSKVPQADAFGRRLGYHMALKDIADLQAAAKGGDLNALRWLREDFHLDALSPPDRVKFEAARWTNKVNLRTGPLDTPVIAHMPRVKAAFHLQKFNLSWTNRLYNGYYKPLTEAIKAGDREGIKRHIRRTVQLSGAGIIVGEGISDTIHALMGRADDRPGGTLPQFVTDIVNGDAEARDVVYRALDDMAFAGLFGYLQIVKEGILARGSAIESASRLVGMKVGAGYSNVGELVAHAGQVAKTGIAGTDKEFARAARAAGRAVASRVPIAGWAVAPRLFAGGESSERDRALAEITRATKRKDWKNVAYWQTWFYKRHGKNISPKSIGKALSE